jgi:tetratricopeptide (TPR) repeat protein
VSRRLLTLAAACAAALASGTAAARDKDDGTVVQDLAYGEVLFEFFQEDYFSALTRLLAAQSRAELPNHAAESELMLGGLYLSYGQHRLAGEIFERVLQQSVDQQLHDRAWFFLAKIWYQRGYLNESEAALARISGELPEEIEPQRQILYAQVLMDQGRFQDALAALAAWRRPGDAWVGYAKFNIGVSLVRLGQVEAGARVLDEVGQIDPKNPSFDSLRDKANVALGYAWLQASRPVEAKPSLQRVRLNGPFSNKALLGVGWSDAEAANYRGALTPWLELRNRSLLDSAVQESLLAVPYAFAQLGADKQAADHYVDAIEAFNGEISRLTSSIDAIERGELITELLGEHADTATDASGWYWRLERVPDTVESRYLYELLASNRFQEGLKSYRDLLYLNRNLDRWVESLGAFDDNLDTRQRAY